MIKNKLFERCLADVDPQVRQEVRRNMEGIDNTHIKEEMTNEKIKEYLIKELEEADKYYEESPEGPIKSYWDGYRDAIELILNNFLKEEE